MEIIEPAYSWLMGLGENYGVNPIIFAVIYVGAIPFFSLSIVWLTYNYKRGVSIVLPLLSAMFFFISAYLYLLIAGENVPWWVYIIVFVILLTGSWTTYKKIRTKITHQIDDL
ncbi:MAG: hypothetical protein JJU37_08105 [Balneolaceae bacterium]|nr:hypothetical protein [Balneolaceae bacterium]